MISIHRTHQQVLAIIFSLSAFDGLATYLEMQQGLVTEANPVMALLFNLTGPFAILIKLLLTFAGVYFIMRVQEKSNSKLLAVLIVITALVYMGLGLFHLRILTGG